MLNNTNFFRFCSSNSKALQNDIFLEQNPKEESELLIYVPPNLITRYCLGQLNYFMLYENYTDLKKNTSFIPASKSNLGLLAVLTIMNFNTAMFQPSVLLFFYAFTRVLLSAKRQSIDVISICVLPDMESIGIRTTTSTVTFKMNEITLEKSVSSGKDNYNLIINQVSGIIFAMKEKGRYVHYDLVMALLSGKYARALFVYH